MKTKRKSELLASGFTLIELLVVIAIIAVLASLLFPSISGAMQRSRQTACLANLRQIGVAMGLYVSERQGFLPPVKTANNGSHHWCQFVAPYLRLKLDPPSLITPNAPRGWPPGSRAPANWWPAFERGNPLWGCPEWKGRDSSWNIPAVGPASVSSPGYGMNVRLMHPDPTSTMYWNEVPTIDQVTLPDQRVLVADARDWQVAGANNFNNGAFGFATWAQGSPIRHGERASYLMVDLSARAIDYRKAHMHLYNPGNVPP
ncbi:MAG: type II secretion system GspH family protein [Kiritimatiellae bacterium]|nr:type II secretion system GspH family protein [Kiritimatiellia bacterium]MDW8458025.1 type II secretion system protein [Verrucomicrobiota bacterium]